MNTFNNRNSKINSLKDKIPSQKRKVEKPK